MKRGMLFGITSKRTSSIPEERRLSTNGRQVTLLVALSLCLLSPHQARPQETGAQVPVQIQWLKRSSESVRQDLCFSVDGWSMGLFDTRLWFVLRARNAYGNRLAWMAFRKVVDGPEEGILILALSSEPLRLQSASGCEEIFAALVSTDRSGMLKRGPTRAWSFDISELDSGRLRRFLQRMKGWRLPVLKPLPLFVDVPTVDYYTQTFGGSFSLRISLETVNPSLGDWIENALWKLPKNPPAKECQ